MLGVTCTTLPMSLCQRARAHSGHARDERRALITRGTDPACFHAAKFRITIGVIEVHRSARQHGIGDSDIIQASTHYLVAYRIEDDDPLRDLRLGFDNAARLLEVVVLLLDDDRELVIHAMKARPEYFDLLP